MTHTITAKIFFGNSGNYVHTLDIFETEDIIFAYFRQSGKDFAFIHDKNQKKSLTISGFSENTIGWVGKPEEVYNGWIINLVHPYEIKDSDVIPNQHLQEILDSPSADEQPFLVLAKFTIQ